MVLTASTVEKIVTDFNSCGKFNSCYQCMAFENIREDGQTKFCDMLRMHNKILEDKISMALTS